MLREIRNRLLAAGLLAVAVAAQALSGVSPPVVAEALGRPASTAAAEGGPRADGPSRAEINARDIAARFPAAQQAAMQKTLVSSLDIYRKIEARLRWPANDVSGAMAAYLVGNYMVLNDTAVPDEQFEAVARQLRASDRVRTSLAAQSPQALRDVFEQQAMAGTLMAMAQMSNAQKPLPAASWQHLREMARGQLRAALGADPEGMRIGAQGVTLSRASQAAGPALAAAVDEPSTSSDKASPATGSVLQGRLIYQDAGTRDFVRTTLKTGRSESLPRSKAATNLSSHDSWSAGPALGKGDLVRKDPAGTLSLHDPESFAVTQSLDFSAQKRDVQAPKFYDAKVSGDGSLLLGYWAIDQWQREAKLFVLQRNGKLVDNDSPLRYPRQQYFKSFDWLPDGRYVYLAGKVLVVAQPGRGVISQAPLRLPAGVESDQADVRASPAGDRVLLTLSTTINGTPLGALYTVRLDGSDLRAVTQPSQRLTRGGVRVSPTGAAWSPDGRWIAFLMRGVNPGVGGYMQGCGPVFFLPSDAQSQAIDNIEGSDRWTATLPGSRKPLQACHGVSLIWTR